MPELRTKPDSIELKDSIPSNVRTPGKDDAAEYIQEEVVEKGRWPMDLNKIAEEAGWSRQHIKNTIDDYFIVGNGGEDETKSKVVETVSVPDEIARDVIYLEIPKDVTDPEDYVRGWFSGRLKAYESE